MSSSFLLLFLYNFPIWVKENYCRRSRGKRERDREEGGKLEKREGERDGEGERGGGKDAEEKLTREREKINRELSTDKTPRPGRGELSPTLKYRFSKL